MPTIRFATLSDSTAIAEIYRPYVQDTAISFETCPPSAAEMESRLRETIDKFPWLVSEVDGQIVGYAYAGAYKSRCAYGWSVESTVYIRQGFHGKGVGKALYLKLLTILKDQGAVNVIAGIALPNEGSVALHERLGFEKVAQFKDVGFKLGKWWDVGYWQLQLQKPAYPESLKAPARALEATT